MAKDPAGRSDLAFLNVELQTGLTMSRIALRTDREDKRERTRKHARKAYDSVLHYLPGTNLSPREAEEIEAKLVELRSALRQLGDNL